MTCQYHRATTNQQGCCHQYCQFLASLSHNSKQAIENIYVLDHLIIFNAIILEIMQYRVYKTNVNDVEELRQCIVYEWEHLDQHIIDTAITIRQWRKRLQAYVAAKGGQFEHAL